MAKDKDKAEEIRGKMLDLADDLIHRIKERQLKEDAITYVISLYESAK